MWPERSEGQRLETLARQSLGLYPQSKPPAMRVVMIAPPKTAQAPHLRPCFALGAYRSTLGAKAGESGAPGRFYATHHRRPERAE